MGNEFCAISTKLKAMRAGHLTSAEYSDLLEKHSVGEICSYLKQTVYQSVLSDLNEQDIHRGRLEDRLEQKNREDYLKLFTFVDLDRRKLIRFFFMRDEIKVLKRVLRQCFNHEQTFSPRMDEVKGRFFKEHSKINIELLMQSRNINSVAESCRDTVFYSVLSHAASTNADYPMVCMMIDRLYFQSLWSAVGKYVDKAQRDSLKKYIGSQIDYLNIMWIYRCKRYFKMSNELIYTYLVPVYYRLTKEDITAMVEAADIETCEKIISSGRYSDILYSEDENFLIERNYKKICYKNAKRAYKLCPETMTEIFAFFDLQTIETENLETIIEGVRYNVAPELVRRYIYID